MSQYGQMNESTERWKLIQKTIKNNDFTNIVEIGTWKGMGSTLAVLTSMGDETNFYSLESNFDFYKIAKKNLESYNNKFKLIYGRIIEEKDVLEFTNDLILTNEQKSWLSEDLKNMNQCSNIYSDLPKKIDFLLLDGGEFSTYKEWELLKDRSRFVGLDDIKTFKCKKIYKEMLQDDSYELIEETNEGNGFCIFLKN